MNKKTHFKGSEHPMFKHGRYVGEKTKQRKSVPQTGATSALRKWMVGRKSEFSIDDVKAALPQFTARQISNALHGMHRRGELRDLDHIGNQSKIWEVAS